MGKKVLSLAIAMMFLLSYSMPASADEGKEDFSNLEKMVKDQNKLIEGLSKTVDKLNNKVTDLQSENQATKDYAKSLENQLNKVAERPMPTMPAQIAQPGIASGLRFSGEATAIFGHIESGEGHENDRATASMNIYLDAPIADNAKFHLNLEGIGGNNDSNFMSIVGLNGDAGSLQDTDGVDRIQIREAKVEANFLDDKLMVYGGKIDPTCYFDRNKVANDEETQFLAYALAYNPAFTQVFGQTYVPGVGAQYDLGEYVDGLGVGLGFLSRDNSGNHIFDSGMTILELDYMTDLLGHEGNYRLYSYIGSIEGTANTNATVDDDGLDDDFAVGFGVSIDQQISDRITLFGRAGRNSVDLAAGDWSIGGAGGATPMKNPIVKHFVSFGLQVADPFADLGIDRADDIFGIGYYQAKLYDTPSMGSFEPENEHLLETYYSYKIRDNIAVSPYIQFVKQVGGNKDRDISSIMGVRSHITFE